MYKLHIVFHKVKESWHDDVLEHLQEFWDKRIKPVSGVELDLTFEVTKNNEVVNFKFFTFHEATGKNAYGTANGKDIVRGYVKPNTYHQVLFVHNALEASNYAEIVKDKNNFVNSFAFYEELYSNTEYTEVVVEKSISWPKKSATHETMHALVKKFYRAGINEWIDHMDGTVVDGKWVHYYLNDDEYAPDGNYSRTINAMAKTKLWYLLESDKRNMYEFRQVAGEKTIVVNRNGKWLELSTPEDGWEIVKRELQLYGELKLISRSEVTANYGGRGRFGIIFEEVK